MKDKQPIPRWRIPLVNRIDEPEEAPVVFFLLGISTAVGGYAVMHGWGTLHDIVGDFYANLAMECFGIAITVLIIERLYERRSKIVSEKEEKERLILQMGSPDNAFAVEAARQLERRGWLKDGSLVRANLRDADLSKADLFKADLSKANLMGVNLSSANLLGAYLSGIYLMGSNLSNARLHNADLSEANLTGANLSRAELNGVNLVKAELLGANLSGAELESANLSEAQLGYTLLVGTNLHKAYLGRANLRGADLRKAYLRTAILDGTDLKDSKYDFDTHWPDGFDPVAAGAIKVDDAA